MVQDKNEKKMTIIEQLSLLEPSIIMHLKTTQIKTFMYTSLCGLDLFLFGFKMSEKEKQR